MKALMQFRILKWGSLALMSAAIGAVVYCWPVLIQEFTDKTYGPEKKIVYRPPNPACPKPANDVPSLTPTIRPSITPTPTELPPPPPIGNELMPGDDITSYVLYRNAMYHVGIPVFETEIPKSWSVYRDRNAIDSTIMHFGPSQRMYDGAVSEVPSYIRVRIKYDEKLARKDPALWKPTEGQELFDGAIISKWEDYDVNGMHAKRVMVGGLDIYDTTYIVKDAMIITITTSRGNTQVYRHMLDTFKVLWAKNL